MRESQLRTKAKCVSQPQPAAGMLLLRIEVYHGDNLVGILGEDLALVERSVPFSSKLLDLETSAKELCPAGQFGFGDWFVLDSAVYRLAAFEVFRHESKETTGTQKLALPKSRLELHCARTRCIFSACERNG